MRHPFNGDKQARAGDGAMHGANEKRDVCSIRKYQYCPIIGGVEMETTSGAEAV